MEQTAKPTPATPQEAEKAFYLAFEQVDPTAMLAVWDDGADVTCIHPMGQALSGRDAVARGWRDILASGHRMHFTLIPLQFTEHGDLAVSLVYEHIRVDEETQARPPILATNVYRRTPSGWRIMVHHASPAVVNLEEAQHTPRSLH